MTAFTTTQYFRGQLFNYLDFITNAGYSNEYSLLEQNIATKMKQASQQATKVHVFEVDDVQGLLRDALRMIVAYFRKVKAMTKTIVEV
jgi:uncharacterized protein (UPF0262 family)